MKRPSWLRLTLLALALLATLQLLIAGTLFRAYVAEQRHDAGPLPQRLAALAKALEQNDAAAVMTLMNRPSRDELALSLSPTAPSTPQAAAPPRGARAGLWSRIIGRPTQVFRIDEPGRDSLQIVVSLRDGRWLIARVRPALALRWFGLPPGLIAGGIGVVVALVALIALWRGLLPLERLARAVDAFARDATPRALTENGPPETRRIIHAVGAMQAQIAALLADRARRYADLAHDLKTYLTRLRLRIEALAEPSRARAIADIDAMDTIVEAAMLLARLEDAPLKRTPIALHALLKDIADGHELPAPNGTATVLADAALLRRAIDNLIINAQRYGGGAELGLAIDGSTVAIIVADRGPGIAAADRERLRAPFVRGDSARTLNTPGSGLGLSIVERIAERHDGELALRDRVGGGLEARLVLPTVQSLTDA
jgi:two-component system, OmpR family, osmolarity sensor histidine kinase EnvZ